MSNNPPKELLAGAEIVKLTLATLKQQLDKAQSGSMDPRLRAGLTELSKAATQSLSKLSASQKSAVEQIKKKKALADGLAKKNTELLAAAGKEEPTREAPGKQSSEPAIDGSLGIKLGEELLRRIQPNSALDLEAIGQKYLGQSVVDGWNWN